MKNFLYSVVIMALPVGLWAMDRDDENISNSRNLTFSLAHNSYSLCNTPLGFTLDEELNLNSNNNNAMPYNQLSPEILVMIFNNLSVVKLIETAMVCKSWNLSVNTVLQDRLRRFEKSKIIVNSELLAMKKLAVYESFQSLLDMGFSFDDINQIKVEVDKRFKGDLGIMVFNTLPKTGLFDYMATYKGMPSLHSPAFPPLFNRNFTAFDFFIKLNIPGALDALDGVTIDQLKMDDDVYKLCKTPSQFAVVSNNNSDDKNNDNNDDKNNDNRKPYKETNFGLLPKDVVKEISEFLDLESHLFLSMVCKDLNSFAYVADNKYLSAARGYLKDKGENDEEINNIETLFYDKILQDRNHEKGALFYHLIRLVDLNKTSYANIIFETGDFIKVLGQINKQKIPASLLKFMYKISPHIVTLNGNYYRYLDRNNGNLEYVLTCNNTEDEVLQKCRLLWNLGENDNVSPRNTIDVVSFVFRHDLNLVEPCFKLILSKSKKIRCVDIRDLKDIFAKKPTPTAEGAIETLKVYKRW